MGVSRLEVAEFTAAEPVKRDQRGHHAEASLVLQFFCGVVCLQV